MHDSLSRRLSARRFAPPFNVLPLVRVMEITASVPVAGFFAMPLVKNGYGVPVKIWHGKPVIDGEEQDRSERWCIAIGGETMRLDDDGLPEYFDIWDSWPWVAKNPITPAEYEHRLRLMAWAAEHAPNHPAANIYRAIDVRNLAPVTP